MLEARCPLRLAACQNPLAISSGRHHSMKLFRKKKVSRSLARRPHARYACTGRTYSAVKTKSPLRQARRDDGNQTSLDGTKQMILYQSLRGKSPSDPASDPPWCRYQTIASPTGFSVLITTSGGTGYHSPSMGTQ